MKHPMLIALTLLSTTLVAHAGFKLPSGVYETSELEAALEKSKSRQAPITFLISDTDSDCGLCNAATQLIIRELRTPTVLVYARNKSMLPEAARETIRDVDPGKFIPYAYVLSADFTTLIGVVRYEEIKKDGDKAFTELKRSIRKYKAES